MLFRSNIGLVPIFTRLTVVVFGVGVRGLGVGVRGLGVGVRGLGVGVRGLGVGVRGWGLATAVIILLYLASSFGVRALPAFFKMAVVDGDFDTTSDSALFGDFSTLRIFFAISMTLRRRLRLLLSPESI